MKETLIRQVNGILNMLPHPSYELPDGYQVNFFPRSYIDNEDRANAYQREVYKAAAALLKKHKLTSVLDIGCGYGLKLKEFILPLTAKVVGVDRERSIKYCRTHHAFGQWFADDISQPKLTLPSPPQLIICADVIEHLVNPDRLIAYFRRLANRKTWIVLSTPDRDKVRGEQTFGPPPNTAHVREWNSRELLDYLKSQGLKIFSHRLVEDVAGEHPDTPNRKYGKTCQLVVAKLGK